VRTGPERHGGIAGALAVAVSEDPARLDRIGAEWQALFDAAGAPNPFLSWEWLHEWWRAFGAGRRLRLVEARDEGGALCGILALVRRAGPRPGRRWQLLGNGIGGADGLDALVAGARAGEARSALLAAALDAGGWDLLDLEDLPCGSPSVKLLRGLAALREQRLEVVRRFACPGFAVRGTFAAHLGRLRRRETYGRRVRWLARQPGFRIEVAPPEQAQAAMADFLRLHRLRWEAEGGSYGIPPGRAEAFHLALAPRLAARGWLRLYRLLVGDAALAAVYAIELGRRFYYYQSGYDPAWAARSPGFVLVGRTVEDAYERGLTDYDFLRGEEAYKLDWTADRRETCAVRVRAATLRARTDRAAEAAFDAARSVARRVAPAGVWAALRQARRRAEAGRSDASRGEAAGRGRGPGFDPEATSHA
jgi:CelD/BcsL family acetyltransferase involved in cellulose biosynthesis